MAPLAKRFRVGAKLPTPVGVCVRGALHTAARRWPVVSRDEMTAEWAAELHEIEHDPTRATVQRAWRALAYTVSLACARTQKERLPEGYGMHKKREVLGLVAASFVMSAVTTVVMVGGTMAEERFIDPIKGFHAAPYFYDWAAYLVLPCAAACWFTGRWLVRRAPLRASKPLTAGVLTVSHVLLGMALLLGLSAPVGLFGFAFFALFAIAPGLAVFSAAYLFGHPDIEPAVARFHGQIRRSLGDARQAKA